MWIYCITNLINGKIYVGQHVGSDLNKYWQINVRRAFSENRRNNKPALYNAIRKYGPQSFAISILINPIDKQQTNKLEQFFIRTLDARDPHIGYNIALGGTGGNTCEGKTHRSDTKEKMRQSALGKTKSNEHRQNLSAAKLGKPCPSVSESNIRRRSPNPTPGAIRNRRYRERLKQKGTISNGPLDP